MAAIGITRSTPGGRPRHRRRRLTRLQGLSAATLVCVFILVVIGGVVRVTGSGLGCPDWPLCYGRLLPPAEYTAIIEYTHRFVASVIVGPLVIATAAVALASYRNDRPVWLPAAISVPLLLIQGLLGGITVLTELPGGIVALHLGAALALLAVCLLIMIAAFRSPTASAAGAPSDANATTGSAGAPSDAATSTTGTSAGHHRWALAGALGVYIVIITGALVTAMDATGACITWPLCQGQAFPMHHLSAVHMFHRYAAAVLGALLIYAAWRTIAAAGSERAGSRHAGSGRAGSLRWLAWLTLATFAAQIIIGAFTIWMDFQPHWRALHLTAATAVWTAAAAMAIVACFNARPAAPARNLDTV